MADLLTLQDLFGTVNHECIQILLMRSKIKIIGFSCCLQGISNRRLQFSNGKWPIMFGDHSNNPVSLTAQRIRIV